MLYLYIALSAAAAAAAAALFVWFNNGCIKVSRRKISLEGAGRLKIIHLSDLHGKRFGRGNVRLIKRVAEEKPDFIVVTGDIIHRYTPANTQTAERLISALAQLAPVLYVAGNHEMRNKGYRFLRKQLMEAGATVLDDEVTAVCGVTVAGLNGASLRNDKIYKITPQASPKILLAHEPQFFEKYASAGYDLVFCGHAHGGQWRIPFTGIGLYAPGQGRFPEYTAGAHTVVIPPESEAPRLAHRSVGPSVFNCHSERSEESEKAGHTCTMVVSRGLGNSSFPLRLFNRPEIVVAEIN